MGHVIRAKCNLFTDQVHVVIVGSTHTYNKHLGLTIITFAHTADDQVVLT